MYRRRLNVGNSGPDRFLYRENLHWMAKDIARFPAWCTGGTRVPPCRLPHSECTALVRRVDNWKRISSDKLCKFRRIVLVRIHGSLPFAASCNVDFYFYSYNTFDIAEFSWFWIINNISKTVFSKTNQELYSVIDCSHESSCRILYE